MSIWLKVLWIALSIYILLNLIVYLVQDFFYFHPEKLPQFFSYEYEGDLPVEEIFINLPDGSKINAIHFKIKNAKGVIFYFKGNTRSIKGWGKFSKDFLTKNYDFFMIDYPGFGKSTGQRNEKKVYEYCQVAYDWLQERYAEDQIVIYGRSMGSGFAAKTASNNQPKMLVLDAPYYSFIRLAKRYTWIIPLKYILKYDIPLHKFVKRTACPIYIIHGSKDKLIPYKFSLKLKKENPKIKLFTIKGAKHNNLPSFPKYQKALYNILNHPDAIDKTNFS